MNEAIAGPWVNGKKVGYGPTVDDVKNSPYYPLLGYPDFIDKAFRYAHEADPNALLFYNDYYLTNRPEKAIAVRDMVKGNI